MRGLEKKIRGFCTVEVCGAITEALINACAANSVQLWNIEARDGCTIRLCVYEDELPLLKELARACMCEIAVLDAAGGRRLGAAMKRRAGLIAASLVGLALLVLSSFFIWDIDVYGCEELTEGAVLRALSECGVDCGRYWPTLSTDLVRADMLSRMPELAWMSVNVSGSRAVVLVAERAEKPEIYQESAGADIVASNTGVIERVSALSGRGVVGVGQSVTRGETLISGTMESISDPPRLVRAQGTVTARTWREWSAACPTQLQKKTPRGGVRRRVAVKFGKNRLNFYIGAGNTVDGCDKIVHNYKLGVKGLFALPVTLIVEELRPYKADGASTADIAGMGADLKAALMRAVDGQVISASLTAGESGGVTLVTLRAACIENIAAVKEYSMDK